MATQVSSVACNFHALCTKYLLTNGLEKNVNINNR